MTVSPARAQSDAWSPPLRLSPPGATASFPDVLADAAGGTHVVWSSSDDRYDVVIYTALALDAAAWDAPVDVVANAHNPGEFYVSRPVLTMASTWQMALGVHAPRDLLYVATAPAFNAPDPFAWSNNLVASPGYHVVPLANGDLLHVVYTQPFSGSGCQACLHLFYANSSDGGVSWSSLVDVGRRSDSGAAKPQLLAGRDGALHLVWESGLDGDRGYVTGTVRVMYAASYDNGATWSLPYDLDAISPDEYSDEVAARNVAIAQAGDGSLVAAWWQMPQDLVFHSISTDAGRTWSDPRTVPSVWGVGRLSRTRQDTVAMVTDSSGVVHLLMVGRLGAEDTSVALLHLSYLGGTWSFPRTVAAYDTDLPEWPRATVGLGNHLRVVWHLRPGALRPKPDDAPWEVWEAHMTLPSPALPAIAMPTSQPLAPTDAPVTVATIAAASPAPTLLPAAARAAPAAPVTIRTLMSENDDVLLLALALLPAALLVVAGLLWQRRR